MCDKQLLKNVAQTERRSHKKPDTIYTIRQGSEHVHYLLQIQTHNLIICHPVQSCLIFDACVALKIQGTQKFAQM